MRKKMQLRSLLIGGIFTLLFFGLVGRLYWVQVVKASDLLIQAEAAWSEKKVLLSTKGTILDRNNKILVQDGVSYTVVVFPKIIHDNKIESVVVEALAPILEMTSSDQRLKLHSLVTKMKENGEFYSQVEVRSEGWKIDTEVAEQIKEVIVSKDLKGVQLIEEQKRYYPAQRMASHILGYRNKEGEAVLGIEKFYDKQLKGKSGLITYEKDGKSYELPNSKVVFEPAKNGLSIKLTIDENIQLYLEQALANAYEQYNPKSMTAIAVDPNTMEVLGLANYPNYNPNKYWEFNNNGDFYNHAIASQYEPGSTFKVITLAAAVEEGVFDPSATYESGKIKVPGYTIRDHNNIGWGENKMITYLEGLQRSSNVAFVKLGYEALGAQKLKDYINAFGFGLKTGIDLPLESEGKINFRGNIPSEVATAAFGQGRVSVTSIQLITAISAIANGGNLMKPYIVDEIIDPETNEVINKTKPQAIRRVVSEATSKAVGNYLEQVVSDPIGTGHKAYIDGYRVAGKTGTAQKVVNGEYAADKWIVSFIGYAPVENPKIAVIVVADEPDLEGDYLRGGSVVAPVFKEIMIKSLRYFGIAAAPKQKTSVMVSNNYSNPMPDVVGEDVLSATNKLQKNGLNVKVMGSGPSVVKQFPLPETEMLKDELVYLLTQKAEDIAVPDLTGMALRDALKLTGLLHISCEINGEGYVTSQKLLNDEGNRTLQLELKPMN